MNKPLSSNQSSVGIDDTKLKCIVVMVSRFFPKTHPKDGEATHFIEKMEKGSKVHTIRKNYEGWKNRIDEVNEGKAYISCRYWTGKPYCSPRKEFKRFYKDELGVQKLTLFLTCGEIDDNNEIVFRHILADNDGLTETDFNDWFRDVPHGFDDLAIIHFSNLKY